MDDVRQAVHAVAESLITHIRREDNTKYGPIATEETKFKELIKDGEYEDVRVGDLPANQYGAIKKVDGVDSLVFDTENIPNQILIEDSNKFLSLHKKSDGFAVENRGGIAKAMKTNEDLVETIFNRYEARLPQRLLPVLEEALILRTTEQTQSLSRGTVYDWRGEIASKHRERGNDPQEAQHLISLCSTGYFDKGNVFDEMYTELVENGIKAKEDYKEILGMYVRKNPFAVFVRSNGMTAEEVCALTIDKAMKIDRYPGSPSFIDICGKGNETHDIINQARNELNREYEAEMTAYPDQELEQYILRVSPDSL
jgi:hypothetical protein